MGLGLHAVDAIGREHAYRPIKGDVLFIGRQATYFTPNGLAAQLRSHGHAVDASAIEVDRTTIHRLPGYGEIVTDRSIFHALGHRQREGARCQSLRRRRNRPRPQSSAPGQSQGYGRLHRRWQHPRQRIRSSYDAAQLTHSCFDPAVACWLSTRSTPATVRSRSARRIGSSIISSKTDFPIAKCMSAPGLPAPTTAIGSIRSTWPAKGRVNWCFPSCGGAITPWSLPKRVPHPPRNALPRNIPIVRRKSGRAMKHGFPQSIAPLDRIWRVRWECCCRAWRGADSSGWTRHSSRGRLGRPCRVRSCASGCTGVTGQIADAAAPVAITSRLPYSSPCKQPVGGAPLRRRPHAR